MSTPAQTQPFTLFGSGVVAGGNILTLEDFNGIDGTALTMADLGSKAFGTIDPGNGTQEEQVSFTGITVNPDGTVSLTGIKSVSFITPYTETTGFLKSHGGGARFVLSNTSGFYNDFLSKSSNATITGLYNFTTSPTVPTPTTASQAANKSWVESLVLAGAPDASTTQKGIAKLTTAPVSPTDPIAVGATDVAVTPTADKIVRANGSNKINQGWLDLAADFIFTGAVDITASLWKLGGVAYTGTMALLNEAAAFFNATDITGAEAESLTSGSTISNLHFHKRVLFQATRTANVASGSVTYAHGLGVAPKWVQVHSNGVLGQLVAYSIGGWDGTNNFCNYGYSNGTSTGLATSHTTQCIVYADTGGTQIGAITSVDATNITIAWTKGSSPSGITMNLFFTCGV